MCRTKRRRLLVLLVLLTLIVAVYCWSHFNDDAIRLANYDRIKIGMSIDDVIRFMGPNPQRSPLFPNGERPWTYVNWSNADGTRWLIVWLDEDGTVLYKDYRDDGLLNKVLRTVGVKPRPDGEPREKGSPKEG